MDERPQRSLRPRKLHPYLPPDVFYIPILDRRPRPDSFSLLQLQSNNYLYPQDTTSPAVELNHQAKTLVKFFNFANKGS